MSGDERQSEGEGLSPDTEEVLRLARAAGRMPSAHKRRLKSAVVARIALASAGTMAAGHATASAMGLLTKTVVGIAVVGSIGAGGYVALRSARRQVTEVAVRADPPQRAPAPPRPAARSPEESAPAFAVAPPVAAPHVRRSPSHRPSAGGGVVALGEETKLLRGADRALRAGDATTALALLDQHAARYPGGVLAPERAAERLIVLCHTGAATPAAVDQFLAAHPSSPLGARVKRACQARR